MAFLGLGIFGLSGCRISSGQGVQGLGCLGCRGLLGFRVFRVLSV